MRRVKYSSDPLDEDDERLRVESHSRPIAYGCRGVPHDVFVGLGEAESKGGYINRMIKP
jgi:hypothetical protein